MGETSKDIGRNQPAMENESMGQEIRILDLRARAFKNWKQNIEALSENDRELSLTIYSIGSSFNSQEKKLEKTYTKCYVSVNQEGQLVAVEGKNSRVLEGSVWVVPAETLEILNKTK